MAEVRVTPPAGVKQASIRLVFDTERVLTQDVEWLARVLHEDIIRGTKFKHGQTLALGWSMLRFTKEAGDLVLMEPDMESVPLCWKLGVSESLAHLRKQKDVAESLVPALTPEFATINQTAIVCKRLLGSIGSILERSEPETDRESGWFVGCVDPEHDHNRASELELTSVYELTVVQHRACLSYLALPPGTSVIRFPSEIDLQFNGVNRDIRPGSFLAMLVESGAA